MQSDLQWESQQIKNYITAESFMTPACCGLLFLFLFRRPDKDVLIQ